MKEQAGSHRRVVDLVLNEVSEVIRSQDEDLQIYTSGATNIFKYPELSDTEKASQLIGTLEHPELADKAKASELISTFEEKQALAEFAKETMEADNGKENTEIQIYIGDETPVQSMKDCSIVTANYALGDGMRGTIGIVGPKRMDYEKVVSTLRSLVAQLNETFKNER